MLIWLRKHRLTATILWAALALAATEGLLLSYFLGSWMTLPLL
jgi:hypothetical protein